MKNVRQIVLIPAYCPSGGLTALLRDLRGLTEIPIIIVDDGSDNEYQTVFEEARTVKDVAVLTHATNLGKGAALKTGFNHALVTFPGIETIVTADADGQHLPADIIAVANAGRPNTLVMGSRRFHRDIPLRSRIGNIFSQYAYRFLTGIALTDTQTGLRNIPRKLALACLHLRSHRYEFETEQLLTAKREKFRFFEIPISTVYLDQNKSSHFSPIFDSLRIYIVLLRYVATSIVTALVDFVVFLMITATGGTIFWATMGARAVALWLQFALLQEFVFKKRGGIAAFTIYVSYVAFTGVVSSILQIQFRPYLFNSIVLTKIVIEGLLWLFGFLFLRDFAFRRDTD